MSLYMSSTYHEDIRLVASEELPWGSLRNKSVLISGASGLICSFLVDVLMYRNETFKDNITVYAISRNTEAAMRDL